jgi:hypothetical protein
VIDAADGYKRHLDGGGAMLVTLAGAMSTAELGLSLAEMIRQERCTPSPAPGPTWKKTSTTWWPTTSTCACPTTAT